MTDMNTTVAISTEQMSRRLTREDTFFDVAMSKKRLDRIVPIMAVHETVPPAKDVRSSFLKQRRSSS